MKIFKIFLIILAILVVFLSYLAFTCYKLSHERQFCIVNASSEILYVNIKFEENIIIDEYIQPFSEKIIRRNLTNGNDVFFNCSIGTTLFDEEYIYESTRLTTKYYILATTDEKLIIDSVYNTVELQSSIVGKILDCCEYFSTKN